MNDCNCGAQDRPDHRPHTDDCAVYQKEQETPKAAPANFRNIAYDGPMGIFTDYGSYDIEPDIRHRMNQGYIKRGTD